MHYFTKTGSGQTQERLQKGRSCRHHNAATLPSYLIRQHGFGVPYASIASINWFMCGLLPPIVQSATADMNHLDVITCTLCLHAHYSVSYLNHRT